MSTYQELYKYNLQGNLVLRLLFSGEYSLEHKGEIVLEDTESAKFLFNDEGNLLALFKPELDKKSA